MSNKKEGKLVLKTFGQLDAGDSLFYYAPDTGIIKESQIVSVHDTDMKTHRAFKVYKNLMDKAPGITIDRLELIKEGMDNSIYHLVILDIREYSAIVKYKDVYSAMATSKEILQQWIKG